VGFTSSKQTRSRGDTATRGNKVPNDAAKVAARESPDPEGRIRKMLDMIESDSPCKMSDLALEFNLSNSRLQHLFKQKTGVGLGRCLTEQRLRRAALLLIHTPLRIKEIAAAVGYEHTSSFTRAFEQRFMQAPLAYRRQGRLGKI
jgi:transcriptional regulator GlxA family with amidase domain